MPKPAIKLVPWDPESTSHIERLVDQRIACGWAAPHVREVWRDAHLAGTKCMWWVVLADNDANLIEKHVSRYPAEKTPLSDTSRALRGVAREPSQTEILPIGHVALDKEHPDAAKLGLPLPTEGAFFIKGLYVSRALHGLGVGSTTMDMVERVATDEPLNAKHLLLDTLLADDARDEKIAMAYTGGPPVEFPPQLWYAKRGYEVIGTAKDFYQEQDRSGKTWPLRTVFMHRNLVKSRDQD